CPHVYEEGNYKYHSPDSQHEVSQHSPRDTEPKTHDKYHDQAYRDDFHPYFSYIEQHDLIHSPEKGAPILDDQVAWNDRQQQEVRPVRATHEFRKSRGSKGDPARARNGEYPTDNKSCNYRMPQEQLAFPWFQASIYHRCALKA